MKARKVTLNLPLDLTERMRLEAEKKNITVTELIRRSLETEMFLNKEESKGSKILLEKERGRMVQVVRR